MENQSSLQTSSSVIPQRHSWLGSRVFWFIGGGLVATGLLIGLIVAIAAVADSLNDSPKPSELARIVARPLVSEGVPEPIVNESEVYAGLSFALAAAQRLGKGSNDNASVAREYAETLNSFKAVLAEAPGTQPLMRAGLDALLGSLGESDGAFARGMIGVGSELSRHSEYAEKLSTIHAKMVGCRLRVAEIAVSQAAAESSVDTIAAVFLESRGPGTVANDTLAMRNVSGVRLVNVMVVTELTGKSGERFRNLFFADSWDPDQILLAISQSASPGRETVTDVSKVLFRVLADGHTSRLVELRPN